MSKKLKVSNKPSEQIIVTPINNQNKKILFSYEYLDLSNSKYNLSAIDNVRRYNQFFNEYLIKLSEYSQNEKKKISDGIWRKRNHVHPIDWNDNSIRESCFTKLNKDLTEQIKDDCWQLGINNSGFRIHGFFISNVFYIVWLDPFHQLYLRK